MNRIHFDKPGAKIEIDLRSSEENHLSRLAFILNYELITSPFFFYSYMADIIFPIAIISAIIFTPYMLYVLIIEKKWSWLLTFLICVLGPLATCLLGIYYLIFPAYIIMVLFVFLFLYFFILRMTVNDRLQEIRAHRQYLLQRALAEREKEYWQNQFENPL